ncbi:MAG: DUF4129 domain-containing protein [Flavobacteriaceae bacterium]|jgi:hypothetical protein
MRFKFVALLIFFCSLGLFHGQASTDEIELDDVPEEILDNNAYEERKMDSLLNSIKETDDVIFPKTFPENYKNKYKSKEYDYTATKPRESLWERLQRKFIELLESIFGSINSNKPFDFAESIMRFLAIIIIGFVLYFLIKFLISKEGSFFFGKKNKKINIEVNELHENIHEINFQESIKGYERNRDFRYAVRYQFLWILKILADKNIIEWNPEKTNRDYMTEIKEKQLQGKFRDATKIFDYVWYGEFEIDENSYHQMKEKWSVFHEKI